MESESRSQLQSYATLEEMPLEHSLSIGESEKSIVPNPVPAT